MCRLVYYDNRNGFDKYDKRILLRLANNAYEKGNVDGCYIGFDNGETKRTMSFKELTKFIIKNSADSKSCMMHLRLATHGKGITCVHGWEFQYKGRGKVYQTAHNGVFYENELEAKDFINDSYTFFHNVFNSKEIKAKKNVLSRLEEYIGEQGGAGVIGLYNKNETILAGVKTELYPMIIKKKDGNNSFLVVSKKDILDFSAVSTKVEKTMVYGGYSLKYDSKEYVEIDYGIDKQILYDKGIENKFMFIKNGIVEVNDDKFDTSYGFKASGSACSTVYTHYDAEEEKGKATPTQEELDWIKKYEEDFPEVKDDDDAAKMLKEAGETAISATSADMNDDVWNYSELDTTTIQKMLNLAFKRDQLGKITELDKLVWAKSLGTDESEYWTVMKLGEAIYADDVTAVKYVDKSMDIYNMAKKSKTKGKSKGKTK